MQQDPSQPSEASQFPYQQPPPPPPPQYTQYPTQPYPPGTPPPPRRSLRRLWLILAISGGILVFTCIARTVIASFLPKPPQTSSQAIVNTQPVATTLVPSPTATLAPTSTPSPTPTRSEPTITPTPTSAHFPATHGRPHIGGPFSDFVGKYGQPIDQGLPGSYNFQSDTTRPDGSRPAGPNVTPNAAGIVIGLDIVSDGATTVSFDQARLHCEPWLPSDAVEFNSAPPYIDYHSSVGEIVMMVNDFGDCVLSIAQS